MAMDYKGNVSVSAGLSSEIYQCPLCNREKRVAYRYTPAEPEPKKGGFLGKVGSIIALGIIVATVSDTGKKKK